MREGDGGKDTDAGSLKKAVAREMQDIDHVSCISLFVELTFAL